MKRTAATLGLLVFASLLPSPATAGIYIPAKEGATTYGLVVGVNQYDALAHLEGAVNDARDIEVALRGYGAKRVITLIDAEASRAAINDAFEQLFAKAAPGSTIVFAFSGGGLQIPANADRSETDGLDEIIILTTYDPNRPDTSGETIRDDEIGSWIARAEAAGIRLLVIADAVYSAGLLDANAEAPERSILMAASLESQLTPELQIDGQTRGALSYAFARALEGKADIDGNGGTTRNELFFYMVATVAQHAEMLQTPVFRPNQETEPGEIILGAGSRPQPGMSR